MRSLIRVLIALATSLLMLAAASAQSEPDVRVVVPEVPGGVIVSNCYRAVGRIYQSYTFDFCLKQRGTYRISGGGLKCEGRLTWGVSGVHVEARLQRARCGRGKSWSADTMRCRPSILLTIISSLLKQDRPLLENLACDYTPARGTGEKPTSFIAHRR